MNKIRATFVSTRTPVEEVAFLRVVSQVRQASALRGLWLFLLWLAVLPVVAQEWCRYAPPVIPSQEWKFRWIACPMADSLSHVWFRQTYVSGSDADVPVSAHLSFASSGLVRVYVNECNVGTAQWYAPLRSVTIDVTPYLNEDTNVVAVLYAPCGPRLERQQLSLSYYGYTESGRPFCYKADSTWLCRVSPASGWLPDGGEWDDGREAENPWRAIQFDPALWVSVEETGCEKVPDTFLTVVAPYSVRLTYIQGKSYFDQEGRGVNYVFKSGIYGQVRLTLREAHPGEMIHYGRNVYVCSGEMDEQASPLFSLDSFNRVLVGGDRFFRRSQIWDIEALSLCYDSCRVN